MPAMSRHLTRLAALVLAAALPVMLAQALYFFESNTRSAAILGVVATVGPIVTAVVTRRKVTPTS